MSITGICVSFIVALFGLAYPLMLQVINRVEDKYKSSLLLERLLNENSWRWYRVNLVISLVLVLAYIIINYPLLNIPDYLLIVLLHVIVIPLILTTSLLVGAFLFTIKNVFTYDSISKLTAYLIKRDREQKKDEEHQFINAIAEILTTAIREQNIPIAHTISDYTYEIFQRFRDKLKDQPVEYPYPYYEFVYKAADELAIAKEKGIPFLEVRIFGGIWFFGEARGYQIHETTYRWTWRILLLAVKHDRIDFIMHHWERADQYYTYNLSPFFTPEETAEDIESRRKFLEFHYALGGLLMYRELHAAIRRFFQFTRSQPPRYELLPDTMDEIFQLYFKFRDPYDRHYVEFVSMYYFPDVEGVNSEYIIKNWICKYLALLFIRQYSIVPYLITMKPLEQPRLPETQQKRKMWIDNVEYFRTLVESTYQNQELLEKYKFGYINDDWCRENNKPTPKEFFDKLIQNLNELYEKAEVEQTIADEKRDEFINYSRDKIISTIDLYKPISNKDEINDDFKEFFITGQSIILDKSAFALNQAADHLNYHSFLADGVSEKYRSGISEVFFYQATKRYLLKKQHLPKGIEQLNINGKDYKIIAFGINNEYLKNLLPEYNEESKTYHNISIYSYPQCNFRLVRESLFVLRNEDLPRIDNIDVKQDEKEKYDLGILDEDRKLYASLLDLNRYNALREEIEKERPNEDMRRSVLAMIAFVSRIRWKKKMNMVSIRVYSEFREKGLPIDPKDIVAI